MKLRAIAASGGRSSLREEYSGVLELLLAIGASRAQLIQQLMIEGLLLAFAGAAAAFFVARGLARFLVAFLNSGGSPVVLDVHPDWRVFAFTASLALLTCVLFALTPALRATRAQPANALSSSNRGTTAGRERFGLRRILVATQVSLSLVLLVGALLFVRSLGNLMTLEPGFKETGILIANVTYGPQDLPDSRLSSMRRNLVERVRAIPGVDAAAETAFVPIDGETWTNTMWMDGSDSSHGHEISRGMVGAGYFRAIGTPLLAGREFDEHDTQASPNVAIVSEAFTRVFSLGPAPVGKKFWIERTPFAAQIVCEIVGVAKDSKYSDLRRDFVPVAFFPMAQSQQRVLSGSILIRSRVRLETLTPLIRRTLAEVSPGILYSFSVFKTQIEDSLLRERLMALLSGLFGALAVLLATVGLYGLISFTVAQRTKEIGIRTALGASRGDVIGLVLRETGVFVAAGIGGGMLLSLMAGRVAASLLFGLEPSDPFTLLAAGTVLAVVALGASVIPARRACAVDAATALRQD
jgi:predicted permease